MNLTPENTETIEAKAQRQAEGAVRELERLAEWATELADRVKRSPKSGYSAYGGESILTDIHTKLAKADALFSLMED